MNETLGREKDVWFNRSDLGWWVKKAAAATIRGVNKMYSRGESRFN